MPYETRAKPQQPHASGATPDQPSLSELKTDIAKLSDLLCKKIDAMHIKISDIEASLKDTSDRALNIEQNEIPKLRNEHKADIAAIEKKLLMMEIYQRKANLLFYGISQNRDENVYDKLRNVFIELGISPEAAAKITIVNAHRLPRKSRTTDGNQGPDPIIAKFAIMTERELLLDAFQGRKKHATDVDDPADRQGASSRPQSRISVRTDLPPAMKYRRGKSSNIAYRLRKEKHLSTKIFVHGTDVILQYKEKSARDWKTYTDEGN
ncbi:uncharacterized protein LOC135154054 [Lytechinus pictus]|uniref:uncharacterized protein LOC135154054 n=1 Tax=Lytechinus pictus TaxID=7653 RepID=UPI0030BA10F3